MGRIGCGRSLWCFGPRHRTCGDRRHGGGHPVPVRDVVGAKRGVHTVGAVQTATHHSAPDFPVLHRDVTCQAFGEAGTPVTWHTVYRLTDSRDSFFFHSRAPCQITGCNSNLSLSWPECATMKRAGAALCSASRPLWSTSTFSGTAPVGPCRSPRGGRGNSGGGTAVSSGVSCGTLFE